MQDLQQTQEEVREWLENADQFNICTVCKKKEDCLVCGAGPQQHYLPACTKEDTLSLKEILFQISLFKVAAKYKVL